MHTKFKNHFQKAPALIHTLTITGPGRGIQETANHGKIPKQRIFSIIQILLLTGFLLPCAVQAQETAQETGRSAITMGYFGETITHPGFFAGYEHNLRPQNRYQLFLSFTLGGYAHRRNHTGLFSEVQLGQRLNFRSGLLLEQSIGIGYLHTFLNGGPVYEVNDNGVVSKSRNPGRSHLMPSVSLGFGWNVARSEALPLLLFVRPKVFWQYPFNGYALPHLALQAGVTKVVR
jgi:hypothetical protein